MNFTIFLLFAAMAIAFTQEAHLFDFSKMPLCADRCDILHKVEHHCLSWLPLGTVMAMDCICIHDELVSLHNTGSICPHACGYEESEVIHLYYNDFCQKLPADHTYFITTTEPPSTSSTSTSSMVTNEPTSTIDPPSASPTPSPADVDDKAELHGTWISTHSKYLIIAGVMLGVTLLALLLLAFLLHRRRQKVELERAYQENGLIPLQLRSRPQTSRPLSASLSAENFSATVPSSPLALSPSAHSFGETLRSWEQEFQEREESFARRDDLRERIARHMAAQDRAK